MLRLSSYLTKMFRQYRSFLMFLHDVGTLYRPLSRCVTFFFGMSTGNSRKLGSQLQEEISVKISVVILLIYRTYRRKSTFVKYFDKL